MITNPAETPGQTPTQIIYDGECPFCSAYVRMVRLRETLGPVELLDARQGGPVVAEIDAAGLDLDEGMVLKHQGQLYHGADTIHMLALMTTPSSWFNRINALVFRNRTLAKILYPVLRAGRNAALFLMGRKPIKRGG